MGISQALLILSLHMGSTVALTAPPEGSVPQSSSQSQTNKDDDVVVLDQHHFEIPIRYDPALKSEIKELELYRSTDAGKNWKRILTVTPDEKCFSVQVLADGDYWFSMRIMNKSGSSEPANVSTVPPALHVRIDTKMKKVASASPASGDDPIVEQMKVDGLKFAIPVQAASSEKKRIKRVTLFMSTDRKSWTKQASVAPEKSTFEVRVPKAGTYFFRTQTQYKDGTKTPLNLTEMKSLIRVEVSKQKPDSSNPDDFRIELPLVPEPSLKVQVEGLRKDLGVLQDQITRQEIARIRTDLKQLQLRVSKLSPDEAREQIGRLLARLNELEEFLSKE